MCEKISHVSSDVKVILRKANDDTGTFFFTAQCPLNLQKSLNPM